jgi:N-acetylglucosaminyldiphosphoundecaprenol N-acetyl-beta-D-mannosaminyltransferase
VLWCGGSANDINVFSEYISVNWPSVHSKSKYAHGFKSNEDIVNLGKGFSCVILGLGSPKQELVGEKLAELMVPRVYTCGAFISQTAQQNGTEYYPFVFKFLNLRWLYRALREKGHHKRLTYALSKSVTSFKYIK